MSIHQLIPNASVWIVIFVQTMKYPYKFIKEDAMEVVLNVEFAILEQILLKI